MLTMLTLSREYVISCHPNVLPVVTTLLPEMLPLKFLIACDVTDVTGF